MPLRKVTKDPKKNKGLYEYYRAADINKATEAYYYSFTGADNKTKKVKSTSMDLAEVRAERAAVQAEISTSKEANADGVSMILDKLVDDWIDMREKKANAKRDKASYLNHISPVLGTKQVADITASNIATLRTALEKKGLAKPTINNIFISLKAMVNHAENNRDIVTRRPFKKIKVSKSQNEQMRVLTDEEVDTIFNKAEELDARLYFMLKVLFYTAQRPKSILALKCRDIDLDKNTIHLEEIKGQKATTMPISSKLKPLFEEWLADKEPHEQLIPIGYDRISSLAQQVFEPLNLHLFAKKKMTPQQHKEARHKAYYEHRAKWASMYSLRHTAATRILSNTGNIKLAKEILRHSDLKMTEIYAKISDKQKQEGVDAI